MTTNKIHLTEEQSPSPLSHPEALEAKLKTHRLGERASSPSERAPEEPAADLENYQPQSSCAAGSRVDQIISRQLCSNGPKIPSSYYVKMKARMVEANRRPGHPPSAYCLFSEKRRLDFRHSTLSLSQKEIFKTIKREWKTLVDKSKFKEAAHALYLEYKDLMNEWEEIQGQGGQHDKSCIQRPSARSPRAENLYHGSRMITTEDLASEQHGQPVQGHCSRSRAQPLEEERSKNLVLPAAEASPMISGSFGSPSADNVTITFPKEALHMKQNQFADHRPTTDSLADGATLAHTAQTINGRNEAAAASSLEQRAGAESQIEKIQARMTWRQTNYTIRTRDRSRPDLDQTANSLPVDPVYLSCLTNELPADLESGRFPSRSLPYPWSKQSAQLGKRSWMPYQISEMISTHQPTSKRLRVDKQHPPTSERNPQEPSWVQILAERLLKI